MGFSEISILCWMIFVPCIVFTISMIVLYLVVRKAVRDEFEKSSVTTLHPAKPEDSTSQEPSRP